MLFIKTKKREEIILTPLIYMFFKLVATNISAYEHRRKIKTLLNTGYALETGVN
jgi:hypothetical protein